jgi:3-dehydroquinate dehydratase-1
MATMIQAESVSTTQLKEVGTIQVQEIPGSDKPALLLLHGEGEDDIISIFADVLGQPWETTTSLEDVKAGPLGTIYGMRSSLAVSQAGSWDRSRILINTHCVDGPHPRDDTLTESCDYEYLYTVSNFFRRARLALTET